MIVTRFNPTINGYLHLGHVYLLKVLRDSADELIVRSDHQRYWDWKNSDQIGLFSGMMRQDIEWLGIEVERWTDGRQYHEQVRDLLENQFHCVPETEPFCYDEAPEVVGLGQTWYPYTDYLTCEKVILDWLEGVNWLIRGWDLLTEFSHYVYYQHRFGLQRVRQTFIPRLYWRGDVVSKTEGLFKIKDFRERGIRAEDVLELLSLDCLKDADRPWTIENIRTPQPVLGEWADEFLNR